MKLSVFKVHPVNQSVLLGLVPEGIFLKPLHSSCPTRKEDRWATLARDKNEDVFSVSYSNRRPKYVITKGNVGPWKVTDYHMQQLFLDNHEQLNMFHRQRWKLKSFQENFTYSWSGSAKCYILKFRFTLRKKCVSFLFYFDFFSSLEKHRLYSLLCWMMLDGISPTLEAASNY